MTSLASSPVAIRTLELAAHEIKDPAMAGSEATYNTAASFWHTYISRVFAQGRPITAHDVFQMLGLLALSHTVTHPHSPLASNYVEQAACVAGAAEAAGISYPTITKQRRSEDSEHNDDVSKAVDGVVQSSKDKLGDGATNSVK